MAGLEFYKYGGSAPKSELVQEVIVNSHTFTIGDVARYSSGFAALAAAGNKMLGLVEGFVTNGGVSLDAANNSDYDGTYTPGGKGVGTYVASSDNQTDKKVKVVIRPFVQGMQLKAPLDDTIGTTTGSDLKGYYADLVAASDQLDESSAGTAEAQFMLLGQDPVLLGNNVIVSPAEMVNVF